MTNYNAANERIKHTYYGIKSDAKGLAGPTIDGIAKAVARFEMHTELADFRTLSKEQAISFKVLMSQLRGVSSGEPLSKSTIFSTLRAVEAFFRWLAQQRGYRNRIDPNDVEYFTYSKKDARIATARRERHAPSLDEVNALLAGMPTDSEIQHRNKTLIAFIVLTGARDGAVASMRLGDVNLERRSVFQDARHVKTKNSKTFTSYFFPVGDEIEQIVREWIQYLRNERGFGDNHPIFPCTRVVQDANRQFIATGVGDTPWQSGATICTIVSSAAAAAGLKHFTPHALRTTLGVLGLKLCRTLEDWKAYSQNFGHDHLDTTLTNYSPINATRQGELMQQLGRGGAQSDRVLQLDGTAELARMLRKLGLRVVAAAD